MLRQQKQTRIKDTGHALSNTNTLDNQRTKDLFEVIPPEDSHSSDLDCSACYPDHWARNTRKNNLPIK